MSQGDSMKGYFWTRAFFGLLILIALVGFVVAGATERAMAPFVAGGSVMIFCASVIVILLCIIAERTYEANEQRKELIENLDELNKNISRLNQPRGEPTKD